MRTSLLPAVLALLFLSGLARAQDDSITWLEVADVPLSLLSGPSSDDDILTQLTPREAVELLQRGDQWSHIRRQDGTTGWALNDFLLPWDERNRIDAQRRVGERRPFRIYDAVNKRMVTVNAELGAVSDHVYFYTHARRDSDLLPDDQTLQHLGTLFDEGIYRRSLDFRGVEDPPGLDGDERIVVLFAAGYNDGRGKTTWYARRADMPQETGSRGTGFIGFSLPGGREAAFFLDRPFIILSDLAREFQHMLHHHTGGNRSSWVDAGMATLLLEILEQEQVLEPTRLEPLTGQARIQLDFYEGPSYRTAMSFMLYVQERLGHEFLLEFVRRQEQVLDALDAVLANHPAGLDADTFFADWVLASILLDTTREGGRFGYHLLDRSELALPPFSTRFEHLPAAVRDSTAPYSARYYELPLPQDSAAADHLLLDFRLGVPPPQDALLQFVQVLPDSIDVQRFRASDHRGRPILASLREGAERAFLAISPFTTAARQRTQPVSFSLALRQQPAPEIPQAQVTAVLNLRSAPAIGDNILGTLRPCSLVQVLQRDPQWSQVQDGAGRIGWSHNDYLYHLGAPSPVASPNSCAALTRAAHDGDLAAVQRLLASGAAANGADIFGRTALHEAASWGHHNIIAHLLGAGADVHAQDNAGRTSLDEVFHSGDTGSILLLAQAGVNLDLSDPAFRPLMIEAAASGNNDLLGEILASNHDVNWRDDEGRSALAAAAENGQEETLRQLLAAGADLAMQDARGRTPLMLAAASGRPGALAVLHRAGAAVNRVDDEGHSPLTLAAARGHAVNVAWLLLASDVDVRHALPDSGRNALHLAAANGHDAVVAMLLPGGADPEARDLDGFAPLQLADAAGHERAARYLRMPLAKERMTGPLLPERETHAFLQAAANGNLAEVERFLATGSQLLLVSHDPEGLTALMLAARNGQRDVVLRLLLAGHDPDIRWNTGWDEPALYFTIRDGYDELTAMLLLANAWPAALRNAAPTISALFWAADFGREDIVHLLLGLRGMHRIDVNIREYSGRTALHAAAGREHPEIVKTLLSAGADPNIRAGANYNNRSALDVARRNGNQEIIDLLLAAGAEA